MKDEVISPSKMIAEPSSRETMANFTDDSDNDSSMNEASIGSSGSVSADGRKRSTQEDIDDLLDCASPDTPKKKKRYRKEMITKKCGVCEGCLVTPCNHCSSCRRKCHAICVFAMCIRTPFGISRTRRNVEAWNILATNEKANSSHLQEGHDVDIQVSENGRQDLAADIVAVPASPVASTSSRTLNKKRNISTPEVGSRYRVQHPNHSTWGCIRKISNADKGKVMLIELSDDQSGTRKSLETCLDATAKATAPDECTDPVQTVGRPDLLHNLLLKRCGECSMCTKEDCGRCIACASNKMTTSRFRQVCLFKACAMIPSAEKTLPMPEFPTGWTFCFVSDKQESSSAVELIPAFLPSFNGLTIWNGGRQSAYMTLIARACGYSRETLAAKLERFCTETLGVRRIAVPEHKLLNRRIFRKWADASGVTRTAYGAITECYSRIGDGECFFKMEHYDTTLPDLKKDVSAAVETPLVVLENVSEKTAWGGYMNYLKITDGLDGVEQVNAPFHFKWIVPDTRYVDSEGRLVMSVKGFELVFTVQDSLVSGAGLGLVLTVSDVSNEGRREFVLKPGELIDLGPYAPLLERDRKPFHTQIVKSFIHNWKNEAYSFDANGQNHETFDVTDDKTGELHERALKNVLIRVNETDGKEIPNVIADTVPSGAVNYFLGHGDFAQGAFRLRVDEPVELKVDYGEAYEPVRVREGYPRIEGEKLERMQRSIAADDLCAMDDVATFTAMDVHECLLFLENLEIPTWSAPLITLKRTLIVAIALHCRVQSIEREFLGFTVSEDSLQHICDNGYSQMDANQLSSRSRAIVAQIGSKLGDARKLKTAILSLEQLKEATAKYIGCDSPKDLETYPFHQLHKELVNP